MIQELLNKCNHEIVAIDGKPALITVKFLQFEEWPASVKWHFAMKLEEDKKANIGLDILGITNNDERIEKYAFCKNGGFDNKPDIDCHGKHNTEYFNCPFRNECAPEAQKLLCGCFHSNDFTLHPKEIEVIKLIAQDLLNKQIADKQGVSVNTIITQITNIKNKIKCDSSKGIVRFAIEKGII